MAKLALALLFVATLVRSSAAAPSVSDGFENTFPATGWSRQNLSSSLGTTNWDQYTQDAITAHSGTKFVMSDYLAVGPNGTISNWLFTPEVTIANGVTLRFWTKSEGGGTFADRLEIRASTAGASVNAGASSTSVGDFTELLLEINPALTPTGYPTAWTEYVVTVTGVPVATTGRFAFRYFVTNGGQGGTNGAAVVLDDVEISSLCGDGTEITGEACDDGNDVNGDGCDANCTVSACGNGVTAGDEECDDGNLSDGDGCDSNCTATTCGNGVVTSGEDCDDGNTSELDACLNDCSMVTTPSCGDGVITGQEACDDRNSSGGDGCSSTCKIESGYTCRYDGRSICSRENSGPVNRSGGGGCEVGPVNASRGASGGILVMLGLVGLDLLRRRRARTSRILERAR